MNISKIIIFLMAGLMIQSCTNKGDYNPDDYLSVKEKDKILMSTIRYIGKSPENVSIKERFEAKHDAYYLDIASRHRFEQYYIDSNGIHYFLISRPAPSLFDKRVAIAGKLRVDDDGNLVEYEEVFRTWKMKEEDLRKKGPFLFDLMVNGKDLSPYYRINSIEEYIEFPDDNNYYNKSDRMWKVK